MYAFLATDEQTDEQKDIVIA